MVGSSVLILTLSIDPGKKCVKTEFKHKMSFFFHSQLFFYLHDGGESVLLPFSSFLSSSFKFTRSVNYITRENKD